jgi:hypothetical protein
MFLRAADLSRIWSSLRSLRICLRFELPGRVSLCLDERNERSVPEECLDCASLISSTFSHRMKPKKTINRIGRATSQHKITSSTQTVSNAIAFTLSLRFLPERFIVLYSAVSTPVLIAFSSPAALAELTTRVRRSQLTSYTGQYSVNVGSIILQAGYLCELAALKPPGKENRDKRSSENNAPPMRDLIIKHLRSRN